MLLRANDECHKQHLPLVPLLLFFVNKGQRVMKAKLNERKYESANLNLLTSPLTLGLLNREALTRGFKIYGRKDGVQVTPLITDHSRVVVVQPRSDPRSTPCFLLLLLLL